MAIQSNGEVLMRWPVADHRITAGWYYSSGKYHGALDLGVPLRTECGAALKGTVTTVFHWNGKVTSGDNNSYGNFVIITHEPYRGMQLKTLYAHLDEIVVQLGQRVSEGQLIGYTGNTGNSTGPHLHFEVRLSNERRNPLNWLDADFYCANSAVKLGSYTSVVPVDTEEEDSMVQYMGMDCSKWQGDIDWAKVAKAGIKHVMIRAGYGRYSNQVDPCLQQNVEGCEANGIHYGFYWYSYATTTAQAKAEAQLFLATIKKYRPDMPLAYDIEYEKSILALTNAQRTAMVKAFLEEVEAAGYYGILYASTNFIKSYLNYSQLTAYDVWAAQYASRCTCPLPYGMWQYTSSGKVDGVSGNVDLNLIYKDYPSIIKAAGLNGWPKTGNQPAGDGSGSWQDREPEGEQPEAPVMQQPVITAVTAGDHEQFVALAKEIQVELTTTYNDTFAPLTQGDVDKVDTLAKKLQLGSEHYSISQV